jgi:hypothetical protein
MQGKFESTSSMQQFSRIASEASSNSDILYAPYGSMGPKKRLNSVITCVTSVFAASLKQEPKSFPVAATRSLRLYLGIVIHELSSLVHCAVFSLISPLPFTRNHYEHAAYAKHHSQSTVQERGQQYVLNALGPASFNPRSVVLSLATQA